ncbi:hypothetical protein CPB84DRAFT_1776320 [Gymnopilus junonius]|uniref:Uncharacterized protein n=1 Tax=Gymnopilus junonius TaxID=109634 RepID=A0A9P5NQQ6_GYMJU|nr:hypothetical protein CPB84DRAFT_1776320 [Gymnopilus junonius]
MMVVINLERLSCVHICLRFLVATYVQKNKAHYKRETHEPFIFPFLSITSVKVAVFLHPTTFTTFLQRPLYQDKRAPKFPSNCPRLIAILILSITSISLFKDDRGNLATFKRRSDGWASGSSIGNSDISFPAIISSHRLVQKRNIRRLLSRV